MSPLRTVGFIGLGIMGAPMARHLLDHGFALRVYNRTRSKAAPLVAAGATDHASPAEAAEAADAVITMVSDTPDVEAVLFGPRGVVEGARPGTLVIDMTTCSPDATRSFAERARQRGLCPLDAPVSGGDVGAKQATLAIMVGGEAAHVARAMPVFSALGRRIVHVGPSGAGQTVKACNQIVGALNLVAVCEALTFARSSGLDLEKVLAVLTAGASASWALERLGPRIAAGDLAPGFMVRLLQKDLAIVGAAAQGSGLALPGTALATELFAATAAQGAGDLGTQALALAYEALTGVRLRPEIAAEPGPS